jgi:dipeptidase D
MNTIHRINRREQWAGTASRRGVIGALLVGASAISLRHPISTTAHEATPTGAATRIPLGEAVADLAPRAVWEHFFRLTQIPRPSRREERVSDFLGQFGRGLGLETEMDEVGNVLIRKPATPGFEARQGVVLQAHMDMVPVKAAESMHDFETDPIAAYVEEGWIRADGTTLGADNGIGVALIMALLEANDIGHGPLEALFTVNEEDGFTGATALQPGILRGTMLINVDSEEEGVFTIGSAGGVKVDATATYREDSPPADVVGMRVEVAGLRGGHSGVDIDKSRGNAIKLLARLLNEMDDQFSLGLASVTGGDRDNAIPREATAVVAVPESQAAPTATLIAAFAETVRAELSGTEPDLRVTSVSVDVPPRVMQRDAQRRMVDALNACPNGVVRMSDSVPGLVETSTNLGTVAIGDGHLQAEFLVRSAIDSARDAVRQMIESVFALAGVETRYDGEYSGWQPNPESPLLELMLATYRDLFGRDAGIMAVHAGLETSLFGAMDPEMDMISLGPTIQNVHSPDEQLDVDSVGGVWDLMGAALGRVPV